MTKREIEKELAEYLNERYEIIRYSDCWEEKQSNEIFYEGVCAAISQIACWNRRENGTHFVSLNW